MAADEELTTGSDGLAWRPEPRPWSRGDLAAVLVWTFAVAAYFWDAVSLNRALFSFDITEINYPYRDFLARELRAGRFSRWCPGLYGGLPLYSESQAGYLHPLKYLLYPWLPTWQAFNLDTVLSVWLTGLGTYGWLRRHVGPVAALAGAAIFGLSGYVWAHLIHTSMINALPSVPLIVWALESAWSRGRTWPLGFGAIALACQVFAGHLQDTLLTAGLVGLYGLYRAATERDARSRIRALFMAAMLVGAGVALASVQWVPSKELLDRSPRAGGLTWDRLTFGSWSPELLPTVVVREAYGTQARDTDWLDGFYPYQEMDTYLGVLAIGLAVVGAAGYRDRWVAFWVALAGLGGVLMLGRYTFVFDHLNRVPILGSARIPVRFHLWVALATSALAAVGVDRLARPGVVRLRPALVTVGVLVAVSIPILAYVYAPVWTEPNRWTKPYHLAHYRWLGRELAMASARTALIAGLGWAVAARSARESSAARRRVLARLLPVLLIADLLGSHAKDVPTVDPRYWTVPPATARKLLADPSLERILGSSPHPSGVPGFASEPVDFFEIRDTLGWSLPIVWGLKTIGGETPIVSRRVDAFRNEWQYGPGRLDVAGVSHLITPPSRRGPAASAPTAVILRNPNVRPRARLVGRPVYVADEREALAALDRIGLSLGDSLVVEDPDRPLATVAEVAGTATIGIDRPERVEVATDSPTAAYLVLADTFDPGWSATLDGRAVPIRPAYLAFRAVHLPPGRHAVVFTYRPAGFATGLAITLGGAVVTLGLLFWPRRLAGLSPEHGDNGWRRGWPKWGAAVLVLIVLASTLSWKSPGGFTLQERWRNSVHRFTWGAGLEAMRRDPER
jgi:hypothetical protein